MLALPLISITIQKPCDFCMPASVTTPGERISQDMGFSVNEMADLGQGEGTFGYSCFSTVFNTHSVKDRIASISISRRSLGRYEINTA